MKTGNRKSQTGFSLLELMTSVLVLGIVAGALFKQINSAQVRYSVENRRVDLTQQERDFIDQFTRDLHQAGYPGPTQFGGRLDLSSKFTAVGIWMISPTDLKMEADVDGDGIVDEIVYHYDATSAGCPCLLRGSIPKQDGFLPWSQPKPPDVYTQVQGIIPLPAGPAAPVFFQAYDASGTTPLNIGPGITLSSATLTDPTYQFLLNIKNVRITFTTQAQGMDTDAHKSIQVTMTGMARLPNN